MEIDITIHKGKSDQPVVVFIHGLGMDKHFWLDPLTTKMMARNIPIKFLAANHPDLSSSPPLSKLSTGTIPDRIDTLWSVLAENGFNLVCWSQRRPAGPMEAAVEDLKEVMVKVGTVFPDRPVAFVCHSRGGLIARKYMEGRRNPVRALITIATPHRGSSFAQLGKFTGPMVSALKKMLPKNTHGRISEILKNVTDLTEGRSAAELEPGSDFLRGLKDIPSEKVAYLSFGGTSTKLVTIYKWKKINNEVVPYKFVTVPDSLINVAPSSIIPDEITPGKGDVLVTAKSAVLPWSKEHYDFPVNHVSISWHGGVIEKTLALLSKIKAHS